MVDKLTELPPTEISEEEKLERQHRRALRDVDISRAKALVFKADVVRAYKILDNLKFDYISDTAFRDKITRALKSLESVLRDYLLDDSYWNEREDEFRKMSPKEYEDWLNQPVVQQSE